MKPQKCSKCHKKVDIKAYLNGKVVCQRCFRNRKIVILESIPGTHAWHWRRWLNQYYTKPNWGENNG